MNIVILTGAGISAESGINTFRAADGLWENHRIEDVASPEGFARDPALVHHFYNMRRRQLLSDQVAPNQAHYAIARLQREYPGNVLLVTQNVDDLHERGGSEDVVHMHGELLNLRCEYCGDVFRNVQDCEPQRPCPMCKVHGGLRPDIVWFGEMPMAMDQIYDALDAADLFVAIGTSGHVYPAAGFVQVAQAAGAETLELNLEKSHVTSAFDASRRGLASDIVPQWVDSLLSEAQS